MAGLPTIQVLLDDGSGTFPYDITGKAKLGPGYRIKRGRQDELSDVTPGDLTVYLDNNDGRFTLGSTIIASPSPVRPDSRIRVKVTANATTVDRFTGYMSAMPVEWPTGSDQESRVQIAAFDVQSRAERWPLRSIVEEEILADNPVAYFTLGEPDGSTTAVDTSGNQDFPLVILGTGADVVFGTATGPGTDSLTAATFAGNLADGKYLAQEAATTRTLTTVTLGCFFSTTDTNGVMASLWNDAPGTTLLGLGVFGGKLVATGGTEFITSAASVNDGLVHHAAFTWDGATGDLILYLDGVNVGSAVLGAASLYRRVVVGADYDGGAWNIFDGSVSHVALYGSVLSAGRVAAHAGAGLTGFAGESGTARLTRYASFGNVPVGTLDASGTNVPHWDITGSSVADAIRDTAAAEFGIAFIDGAGSLTFHNRTRAVAKVAPDVTVTAIDCDEGTKFDVDLQGIVNYFEVTAGGTGRTQVVRDSRSEEGDGTVTYPGHGRYPESRTYQVATDAEAVDRANWIVGTRSEPVPRVGSLRLDVLSMSAAQQAAMLAIEPNTWIRVTGLPSQTPGGATADLIVQGIEESVSDTAWSLTLNVVARSLFQGWILGDSTYGVLDSTTRLYV